MWQLQLMIKCACGVAATDDALVLDCTCEPHSPHSVKLDGDGKLCESTTDR